MKIQFILTVIVFHFFWNANAQDPIFTQYAIVPETINPGYTGSLETFTGGVLHRSQWPDLDFRVETDFAFASIWSEDWNSGLGIKLLNHRENFTNYTFTEVTGVYTYRVELSDEWSLRPAIEIGYGSKSFGFGNVILADQINIGSGTIDPISIDPNANPNEQVKFIDMGAGMLVTKKDRETEFWGGLTLKHLNKPDISLTDQGNVELDMFFSAHAAYKFPIARYIDIIQFPYETQLLVTGNYMKQGAFSRFDLGTELIFEKFFIGVSSATNPGKKSNNSHFMTSVNALAGIQYQHLTFGISHDFNTSKIGNTGGIYELSLTYQFDLNVHCLGCPQYIP